MITYDKTNGLTEAEMDSALGLRDDVIESVPESDFFEGLFVERSEADRAGLLPVVKDRQIVWTGGVPSIQEIEVPVINSNMYEELATCALNLPYVGREDPEHPGDVTKNVIEKDLKGMTNVEVGFIRLAREMALGSKDSFDRLMDRIKGKPQQRVAQTSIAMGYEDWLKAKAQNETGSRSVSSTIVDVEEGE